jgi:hypothetical protein
MKQVPLGWCNYALLLVTLSTGRSAGERAGRARTKGDKTAHEQLTHDISAGK